MIIRRPAGSGEVSVTQKLWRGIYVSEVVQPRSLYREDICSYWLLLSYRYAFQDVLKFVVCILREAVILHIKQGLLDIIVDQWNRRSHS